MTNEDAFKLSEYGEEQYKARVSPVARAIIDAIDTIAGTYMQEYTGPGDEEESALGVIRHLVCRLRTEL